jgi:hypothetical protein
MKWRDGRERISRREPSDCIPKDYPTVTELCRSQTVELSEGFSRRFKIRNLVRFGGFIHVPSRFYPD